MTEAHPSRLHLLHPALLPSTTRSSSPWSLISSRISTFSEFSSSTVVNYFFSHPPFFLISLSIVRLWTVHTPHLLFSVISATLPHSSRLDDLLTIPIRQTWGFHPASRSLFWLIAHYLFSIRLPPKPPWSPFERIPFDQRSFRFLRQEFWSPNTNNYPSTQQVHPITHTPCECQLSYDTNRIFGVFDVSELGNPPSVILMSYTDGKERFKPTYITINKSKKLIKTKKNKKEKKKKNRITLWK